jgi:hypothetical protein
MSAKDKTAILKAAKCYVCDDLGLDHAGFDGYNNRDVHFDHYQVPFGTVGKTSEDTLPIHAAAGGSIPDDSDFETSTRRNCHRLRRNEYTSRGAYVAVLRARMEMRTVQYVDDVSQNRDRVPSEQKYELPVTWRDGKAVLIGKTYSVVAEERRGRRWRRFLTTLRADQIFTDDTSQVRPAAPKVLETMVRTFIADGFPMFAPVNARVDKCGHVVIFDGNHRATSFALAFGVKELMPVMVWDIEPDEDNCAIRDGSADKTGGEA